MRASDTVLATEAEKDAKYDVCRASSDAKGRAWIRLLAR